MSGHSGEQKTERDLLLRPSQGNTDILHCNLSLHMADHSSWPPENRKKRKYAKMTFGEKCNPVKNKTKLNVKYSILSSIQHIL